MHVIWELSRFCSTALDYTRWQQEIHKCFFNKYFRQPKATRNNELNIRFDQNTILSFSKQVQIKADVWPEFYPSEFSIQGDSN